MQIYTTGITDTPTSDNALSNAYIAFPFIREKVVIAIANEWQYYFTAMALGYGRYVTDADVTSQKGKEEYLAGYITWAIRPRQRQAVTTISDIAAGVGAGGANFLVTLSATDNWIQPGMILKYQFAATGTNVMFIVFSGPVANGPNWDYQFKLMSGASAVTPGDIPIGSQIGYTSLGNASCTTSIVPTPIKYYNIYRNYNTTMKSSHQFCKTGIEQRTWFIGENGKKLWQPTEEYLYDKERILDLEYGLVYNVSTVNANGTTYITDNTGAAVTIGDGLLAQIAAGNVITYNINTYVDQPGQYETFRLLLVNAITNWRIQNGITNKIILYAHCGTKAFSFLQEVLQNFADQAGGSNFVSQLNYKTGEIMEMAITRNICRFKFASVELVLLCCSVFDNPAINTTVQQGVSFQAPPLESFHILISPEVDQDGSPLLKLYFRGGAGLGDVFHNSYIPGTINPFDGYGKNKGIAVTSLSGYVIQKEVEWNLIVSNPAYFINIVPFQA